MKSLMNITKAMADEHRVRALMALRVGELCVCRLVDLLGLATSTVSKHMAILRQAGLVESRKAGRWVHYRLAGRDASPEVRSALRWLIGCVGDDKHVAADAKRLKQLTPNSDSSMCRPSRAKER